MPWLETWGGVQVDQGSPRSLPPPSTPGTWRSREAEPPAPKGCVGGAEWEEESGPSQGGDLGWGVGIADTGKWVFALFFFLYFL